MLQPEVLLAKSKMAAGGSGKRTGGEAEHMATS